MYLGAVHYVVLTLNQCYGSGSGSSISSEFGWLRIQGFKDQILKTYS
jgi:hypothetical protein